jgi:O-antigen ligase
MKQSESVIIRNELALAAVAMWKSYPLIGVGFNAFLVQLPTILPARYLFFLQPPHSVYLLIASELGIIGAGCVIWCMYQLITRLLRLPNKLPLIILLLYGLLGTIDHYPLTLQQGQLLTTLVVILSFLSK